MHLTRIKKEKYGEEYRNHLFEQYKLYVELADRVSARRILANSFFLGIHTALITAFAVLLKFNVLKPTLAGLAPFIAVVLLCFVWWRVIYSYRQLNTGKFAVVHAFETMLPAAPYDEEWSILGRGKESKNYTPLTHVENWVPFCFGLLYLLLAGTLYFGG